MYRGMCGRGYHQSRSLEMTLKPRQSSACRPAVSFDLIYVCPHKIEAHHPQPHSPHINMTEAALTRQLTILNSRNCKQESGEAPSSSRRPHAAHPMYTSTFSHTII
ncbi:hypothetical protein E2C01_051634 [Portunus trituberculatus]|uniref:Uncharacterized protein n=1 Tax=Portunus trituberculatus TaxID=210409 RepID=A0A5B7GJF3_PORTR|nr:hypothetical protein [Portunus trituberculatus]